MSAGLEGKLSLDDAGAESKRETAASGGFVAMNFIEDLSSIESLCGVCLFLMGISRSDC